MATHSSVLAWRIPGMGEPGGLPSMRLHRVGHDWSDLAAAAAASLSGFVQSTLHELDLQNLYHIATVILFPSQLRKLGPQRLHLLPKVTFPTGIAQIYTPGLPDSKPLLSTATLNYSTSQAVTYDRPRPALNLQGALLPVAAVSRLGVRRLVFQASWTLGPIDTQGQVGSRVPWSHRFGTRGLGGMAKFLEYIVRL